MDMADIRCFTTIAATTVNWLIDRRVEKPYLIFPGIVFAVAAIVLGALSHRSHQTVCQLVWTIHLVGLKPKVGAFKGQIAALAERHPRRIKCKSGLRL